MARASSFNEDTLLACACVVACLPFCSTACCLWRCSHQPYRESKAQSRRKPQQRGAGSAGPAGKSKTGSSATAASSRGFAGMGLDGGYRASRGGSSAADRDQDEDDEDNEDNDEDPDADDEGDSDQERDDGDGDGGSDGTWFSRSSLWR